VTALQSDADRETRRKQREEEQLKKQVQNN
jgi:hypothetical protein